MAESFFAPAPECHAINFYKAAVCECGESRFGELAANESGIIQRSPVGHDGGVTGDRCLAAATDLTVSKEEHFDGKLLPNHCLPAS